MGLFYNYRKSGRGIDTHAPQKSRIVVYFGMLFRKFWKILEANLLYFVFFMPVFLGYYAFFNVRNHTVGYTLTALCAAAFAVCFGPATTGLFRIMRNFSMDRHSFIISDFKKGFTGSFKKSLAAGIINIVVFVSVIAAVKVYPDMARTMENDLIYVLLALTVALGLAVMMMSFYAYLMIAATDISFKNILKNSVALAVMAKKQTIVSGLTALLLGGAFAALTIYNLYTVFALPFLPAGIIVFTGSFACYPVIQKYVINPYYERLGEKNPELFESDEEAVFEDMGGREEPIEPREKPKKGRTIS